MSIFGCGSTYNIVVIVTCMYSCSVHHARYYRGDYYNVPYWSNKCQAIKNGGWPRSDIVIPCVRMLSKGRVTAVSVSMSISMSVDTKMSSLAEIRAFYCNL